MDKHNEHWRMPSEMENPKFISLSASPKIPIPSLPCTLENVQLILMSSKTNL